MEPIEGYFPAIITPETYEAVRALDRPTGRAPSTAIASMFSGIVKCEECGGPMVRARKGTAEKGLYHVFVCQNAKLGQSCESRSVRQEVVENALIQGVDRFILDAPSFDEELTANLATVETAIDVTRDQIEALVEAISRNPLPSLITKLSEREDALRELGQQREITEVALRDTAKPVVSKRLDDLEALLRTSESIDVGRANVLLRQLVDHAVIVFDRSASRRRPRGELKFVWKGGVETWLRWGALFNPS